MGVEEQVRDALECLAPHFGDRRFSVEHFDYGSGDLISDTEEELALSEDRPCKRIFNTGKNVSRHLFYEYVNESLANNRTVSIGDLLINTAACYGANIYHSKRCNQKHPLPAENITLLMREFAEVTALAMRTPPGDGRLFVNTCLLNTARLAEALGYLIFERFGDTKVREFAGMEVTAALEFLKTLAFDYTNRN